MSFPEVNFITAKQADTFQSVCNLLSGPFALFLIECYYKDLSPGSYDALEVKHHNLPHLNG